MPSAFHEVRFPISVSTGGSGGPTRKTEIVTTGSGREERIARWSRSRRIYDAGTGVKSLADLYTVLEFFEERRGRLYGFRWRDRTDYSSAAFGQIITPFDQVIGIGDGTNKIFQLTKTYGRDFAPYRRIIEKPVLASIRIALDGQEVLPDQNLSFDAATGGVTFPDALIPAIGQVITAGFEFDVPVRFDRDEITIDHAAFIAGEIPHIPLIEIIP